MFDVIMKTLRSTTPLALALSLTAVGSVEAQDTQPWAWDRPDAYAPAGVDFQRVMPAGAFELFHRFGYTKLAGTRVETGPELEDAVLLSIFPIVPAKTTTSRYELGGVYGVTDWLSVTGEVAYLLSETDQFTETEEFSTTSDGISDISVGALARFLSEGSYRSHVSLGMSIPVGTIDATDVTPLSFGEEVVLPYPQQLGSGTIDIKPGASFEAQNEHGTFGARVWGVTRIGENDRDYTLGDRFGGTAWFAPRFNDHFSGSIRFRWETWGDVRGLDPELDPLGDQQAYPLSQGGNRLDVPVGLNFYPANGSMGAVRVSTEVIFPVRHDLNGPQLGTDWGFRFRLSKAF